MEQNSLSFRYLAETVGIPIEIISNEYNEFHGNEHQKIVFQIKEEEPDLWAIGVLFTLSLMSFTYAAPRGYSENQLGAALLRRPLLTVSGSFCIVSY